MIRTIAIASCLLLGGCPSTVVHDFCQLYEPVWVSAGKMVNGVIVGKQDSDQTIYQTRRNNAKYDELCK